MNEKSPLLQLSSGGGGGAGARDIQLTPNKIDIERGNDNSEDVCEFYEYNRSTTVYISMSLIYCFIICGLVTVALGAALEDLASNVGHIATDIGTIYVARGVGSVLGSILSFYIFEYNNAVKALVVNEALAAAVALSMPFITSLWTLHTAYFMIGGVTSILQAGAMLLLRKLHRDRAGPWLAAFGACFVSAGVVVPAVQLLVPSLVMQFIFFSALVLLGVGWLLTLPPLREDIHTPSHIPSPSATTSSASPGVNADPDVGPAPHYWAECVVAAMIFFAIGGGDSLTFYLETYVDGSATLAGHVSKELLLLIFFVSATLGDSLGILAQVDLSDRFLSLQSAGLFLVGAAGLLLVLLCPTSPAALWVGVSVFGLCNAPSISYCFNLVHRLSKPSATSTAIIMLGLSLGISLVPYLTSRLWRTLDSPLVLMGVGCASALLPLLLLFVAPACSYMKTERSFISVF